MELCSAGSRDLVESFSFTVAFRAFLKEKADESIGQAIKTSKDPTTFTVLFEDTAALLGLVVALVGIFLAHSLNSPVLDGVASGVIGVILTSVAGFLIYESKGLLVGEGVDKKTVAGIRRLAKNDPAIGKLTNPLTMHFGPETILLAVDIEFEKKLSAIRIAESVGRFKTAVRAEYPFVRYIYVETRLSVDAHMQNRRTNGDL